MLILVISALVKEVIIPLPSINEQQAIVAELETIEEENNKSKDWPGNWSVFFSQISSFTEFFLCGTIKKIAL